MFNQRNHSSEIGMLEEMNNKLKDRYEFYKVRMAEVSRKSAHFIPKVIFPKKYPVLQDSLRSLQNELESLKKEKESLSNPKNKNFSDLEELKKVLEGKIKSIKSENETIRSKLKAEETSNDEPALITEVVALKKRANDLEAAHEKNLQIIKEMQKEKESSRKTPGKESEDDSTDNKPIDKLLKLEQNLRIVIKSNENKFKSMFKELEITLEKLNSDKICLQMKILKTTQQERLLQMTLDQNHSIDHSYADANFLYKPSIRGLYH